MSSGAPNGGISPRQGVANVAAYALVAVCTLVLLALCFRVLFIDRVPVNLAAAWSGDNIIAFLAKVSLTVPPLFALLKLIDNQWGGLLASHKTQQAAADAATKADQLQVQVNGVMDVRIANAVTAALKAYSQTGGDLGATYNAAAQVSKVSSLAAAAAAPAAAPAAAHLAGGGYRGDYSGAGVDGAAVPAGVSGVAAAPRRDGPRGGRRFGWTEGG